MPNTGSDIEVFNVILKIFSYPPAKTDLPHSFLSSCLSLCFSSTLNAFHHTCSCQNLTNPSRPLIGPASIGSHFWSPCSPADLFYLNPNTVWCTMLTMHRIWPCVGVYVYLVHTPYWIVNTLSRAMSLFSLSSSCCGRNIGFGHMVTAGLSESYHQKLEISCYPYYNPQTKEREGNSLCVMCAALYTSF